MTRAKSPIYKVSFRRRREGRTKYRKRLALVKSGQVRMVVRRSNRYVTVQFVRFDPAGDRTILTVDGPKMAKLFSWPAKRNAWSAYLAGLYAGKEAGKAGVKEFILDTGMYTASKGSILFAALKGAVDAGLSTNFQEDKVPMEKLKNPPEEVKKAFEDTKRKIMG
jgi:large subunit ribosomal protein L18